MTSTAIPIRTASRAAIRPAPAQPFASSLAHVLAEIAWLELRLRTHIERTRHEPQAGDEYKGLVISDNEINDLLDREPGTLPFTAARPSPDALGDTRAEDLRAAIDRSCALSQQAGIELRLPALQRIFNLSDFDLRCIVLGLASEIDLRFERLFAYLQDDVTRKLPGINLALNLLCTSWADKIGSRDRFASTAPLIRQHLLRLVEDPARTGEVLLSRSFRLEERIAQFLLGSDEIDTRLRRFTRCVPSQDPADGATLSPDVQAKLHSLGESNASLGRLNVLCLWGAGALESTPAAAVAFGAGTRALLRVDLQRVLNGADGFLELSLALREARLLGAIPCLENFDAALGDDKQPLRDHLVHTLQGVAPFAIFSGKENWTAGPEMAGCELVSVEFPKPGYAARIALWKSHFPNEAAPLDFEELASRFRFDAAQIAAASRTAAHLARWRDPMLPAVTMPDLHEACRIHASRKLTDLGRKITPHHTWADIVLPDDRMRHLREICNCARYRAVVFEQWGFDRKLSLGKGLNILFAGPSGTGKTMGAEIIAGEVGLDLYKIDLSTVVSKYIGETEKNLARIFAEAALSNAILFFDEADSLFGKRTEVRDSHDRYANIEVNYLLQKMEEHEGVVILATNFRKNMDDAFVRRLHFTVEFPFPCEADRRRIWTGVWPPEAPLDHDVDLDFMARRFELPGGNIRNIALAAAFLAADAHTAITMAHLLHATRREYQKMGKVATQSEFG